MKKKTFSFFILILFTLTSISAQETVKVMFNNSLSSPIKNAVHNLTSCWNTSINSSEYETTGSQFSYELRNALHNFSNHLPVTLSLTTNATFLSVKDVQTASGLCIDASLTKQKQVVSVTNVNLYNETLRVTNSLGQQVKTFQINSDKKQYIDVSDLQENLYYVTPSQNQRNPLKSIIL
ncbi:hypothetical protein [Winogradskyella psychrotolerans]|uniref:hypothetical protein n=1 Tax=Winogradskyella psychrotolerans TaxID=1344585 RepID=UPI001C07116C|nr:hypothetical protein [Winogradskyella psychrotolerans]MBU2928236.1 hypothetical protein [Winogradskyella psychrotolerans]